MQKCLICNGASITKIKKQIHGYHGYGSFNIFKCSDCGSHQIDPNLVDYDIYNNIYSNVDKTTGYDRYHQYSNLVLKEKNPLSLLASLENNYYPINSILNSSKQKLDVLEVGCGLGYLTYAINKSGHSCTGIDVSQIAIDNASKKYGNYYICGTTESLQFDKKFDLIIATELIEHVPSPYEFVQAMKKVLKPRGKIIITTPNKSFYAKDSIWIGDLPPVHVTRITELGLTLAGDKNKLISRLYNMSFAKNSDNLLLNWFILAINSFILHRTVSEPHFLQNAEQIKTIKSKFFECVIKISHLTPIKVLSNLLYSVFKKRTSQMCIVYSDIDA